MLREGLPTLEAQEASSWRMRCQFPFIADAPVTMNDSLRAPSISFKGGNTFFLAPRLGVTTCTAIPTRPLLSTSPLLPSSPDYGGPGRMVFAQSGTLLLPLSHPEGW